ncbi:MAG TPA: glycine zipper 2TM domain-containing protein [Phenylobacterium sp.]|nr:glycine zipper 2TM domain-containing protein [Phenylobacterium sp.]
MRKFLAFTAMAAAIAIPLAAPTDASASCQGRKNTGTVIGGVGGALLGNSISKGGGGAVIGGLGGAVVGHEIAKSGCASTPRRTANRTPRARLAAEQPARKVYYDRYGNAVVSNPPVYAR